ncbi:MAG: hypothetical protein HKN73_06260 [Gemmatimonadetes bacterium]|nr:hypothetical protein [Gemmatimonadota bacterium]
MSGEATVGPPMQDGARDAGRRRKPVVLLGPQRYVRSVGAVAQDFFPTGPVATITAGWQEWEEDDEALDRDLGHRSVNLALYQRALRVMEADPELARAHRLMQSRIRLLAKAYRFRLGLAHKAWQTLDQAQGEESVLGPEREAAFQLIRDLDRRQMDRVGELRAEFGRQYSARDTVLAHRRELEHLVGEVEAVVIEGGHVPVLVNRLRLFDLAPLLRDRAVVACAGAAMVISPTIVFFHDSPPQGPSIPEVAERGLGLFEGVVALPDAAGRLALDDEDRVSRLARRFAPDSCIALDGGSRIEWDGEGWTPRAAGRLTAGGRVEQWGAPA